MSTCTSTEIGTSSDCKVLNSIWLFNHISVSIHECKKVRNTLLYSFIYGMSYIYQHHYCLIYLIFTFYREDIYSSDGERAIHVHTNLI